MQGSTWSADHLWSPQGWLEGACLERVAGGLRVHAQGAAPSGAGRLGHWVLPGLANLHSHAFQRAMAGLAERQGNAEDSFWTWREVMYAFAGRIGPEALRAIATQLYVEMLKAGYTHVCEFHYLHHRPDGSRYADPAAMALALVEAAQDAGIGLTLLPTLYMTGGFDGRPLNARQARFGHAVDAYLALVERLRALESTQLRVGIALHSLRAVPPDALRTVLASGLARDRPIHIHIAEQIGEVQDCLALRQARPVEWLLDNAEVDARWCLVHATHLTDRETARLAGSGAVAGLCPTTEANLGDGLFPLKRYLAAGGAFGIGSDSHISISPVEELRWLEYGQRLAAHRRNIAVRPEAPSTGEVLFGGAWAGGRQAAGIDGAGRLLREDLLVLDEHAPLLAGRDASHLLDTWLFAGNVPLVRHVLAGGEWVVRDFRHRDEERIAEAYRATAEALRATA
ncbi:formimidoylglutamate deiminase [Dokdonella koreensis]|uniref:Formiminoglutamate deiminase n=1 Tax=Dokdonella koreensis DS-123 TaxID=1300342 RepID=A0A160DT41_9GAMM|nr:formimidoylglutamate deiminase [Dokdonella koreensis]ANB17495.1 Formiminoglutamate deiminase [Dokdonella koreensis DS-123]